MTVAHPSKMCYLYTIRRLAKARHWALSLTSRTLNTFPHPVSKSIKLIASHVYLGLPSTLFSSGLIVSTQTVKFPAD